MMEADARKKMLDMLWRLDKLKDINTIIDLTAI
jgi:hypothetical protein